MQSVLFINTYKALGSIHLEKYLFKWPVNKEFLGEKNFNIFCSNFNFFGDVKSV